VHLSVAGGQVQKSSVRSKTLSPEWDERFVFGRKTPVLETDVLLLSLFDSDGNLSAADKLGTVEIPLSDVRGTFAADTGQGVAFKVGALLPGLACR
jgi:Ca2+-dependent lipid-binding protein